MIISEVLLCLSLTIQKRMKLLKYTKPIFHSKTGPDANEIDTKKSEMYMANARTLRWDPTYIPLACVWVSRWVKHNF